LKLTLPPEAYKPAKIEAKKHSVRQLQDSNWQLTLNIHPDDVLQWLLMAPNGTHVGLTVVAMNDDGTEPDPSQRAPKSLGERAVTQAALLCREAKFQKFIAGLVPHPTEFDIDSSDEEQAASRLRWWLKIDSRAELAKDSDAQGLFTDLIQDFMDWAKKETDI
jgi:hypothetical protein